MIKLLVALTELVLQLLKLNKRKQHRENEQAIKQDPVDAWNRRMRGLRVYAPDDPKQLPPEPTNPSDGDGGRGDVEAK